MFERIQSLPNAYSPVWPLVHFIIQVIGQLTTSAQIVEKQLGGSSAIGGQ